MAGIATPPPPAVPAAPATPPPQAPETPPSPPSGPPAPRPEDDPNMSMQRLVARSRERKANEAAGTKEPPKTEPKTPSEPPATPPPAEPGKLTNLLGKALKFTEKPAPPAPPAPATPPAAPAAPAEPPAEPATEPATKPKAKKKTAAPAPASVDPVAIAREAATAATNAAVAAVNRPPPAADPAAELTAQDKRDYEIAVHLSKIDPRYQNAPQIIIDHVRKADAYAANWERANPGKVFDPNDDEHNEFYTQLNRPWSQEEFQDAAIDLRAEQKAAKLREEQNAELSEVRRDQARVELAPVVDHQFANAAVALAEKVDAQVHEALTKKGWEGLQEVDPIIGEVMTATLQQMHPFIEAAIQIDDPRQRFKLDMKNPAHAQWNNVVSVGEANLIGTVLEDGRVFAKRADYVKMPPAQQARHWFLTQDMIIQGAVDYAAEQVKKVAAEQKDRLGRMGFVRATQPAGGAPATPPPPAPPATPAAPPPDKPISPTVGSGAKIDNPPGSGANGNAALVQKMSAILFRK